MDLDLLKTCVRGDLTDMQVDDDGCVTMWFLPEGATPDIGGPGVCINTWMFREIKDAEDDSDWATLATCAPGMPGDQAPVLQEFHLSQGRMLMRFSNVFRGGQALWVRLTRVQP